MSILQINNLNISYKEKNILQNVNLTVEENEIISIMGNSGSGKSTFLSCLNGFLTENGGQYSGQILFDGTDISQYKLIDLRRQISMLFQDSTVFDMSIEKISHIHWNIF
ncbi:ATP-binding cassette domain-containing protein [Finegoldia magna]|uniref:ATP-binding cassette domain-containing protein n=1 Tax=Finegoldia magna TaxID=1260 RepID=UPI00370D9861